MVEPPTQCMVCLGGEGGGGALVNTQHQMLQETQDSSMRHKSRNRGRHRCSSCGWGKESVLVLAAVQTTYPI